ncbi:MAG: hypothetical protein M3335_04065 [Actinomycetota bacterium]|nr:hypothetical protein [Actinomycetota bacterium]
MKYLKMLGLGAVTAALTVLVGAGTASATVFCKTTTTIGCAAGSNDYAAGSSLKLNLTSSAIYETFGGELLWECSGSMLEGKIANTGSTTETVSMPIHTLTWTGCLKHTTTLNTGELEVHHATGQHGEGSGSLTGKRTEWTINGIFGSSCAYGFGAAVNLGTLKGGNPATIAINTILPRISGGFICPAELRWTASYEVMAPRPLYISEN